MGAWLGIGMMVDYRGTTALVTGGGSGIGQALARALTARGAHVIVADVNAEGARDTAAAIDGTAMVVDLAAVGAAATMVADAFKINGRVDFIASNAGVGYSRRLLKVDYDDPAIERLFEVNLFAALRIAQAYVEELTAREQRGRLMITGSENSLSVPATVKGAGLGLYAASKHAVLIAAEWLRDEIEFGNKPLDLHVLMPGGVYTPMIARNLPADPASWPPEMGMILPERCAELALAGVDAGRFHIPTHAHLADDMGPRAKSVLETLQVLALR
jgi:NAD(P)-dependent dehydrogenase (short-subunit alcohol dehydrogenase family)